MNTLVKEIIQPFLESNSKNTALVPGGFKPPTLGHFYLVKEIANRKEIDEVVVLIGHKVREDITKEQSMNIWEIYKKHLPQKVQIQISQKPSPIGDVISIIKNNPQNFYFPVVGYRGEEDKGDLSRFDSLKGKYENYNPIVFKSNLGISGTKVRSVISQNNFEEFNKYLPTELSKEDREQIWRILNSHSLNENSTYSNHIDYKQQIKNLTKYYLQKHPEIKTLPKITFKHGDSENAKDFFGKTAYYNPNTKEIVLYTEGRHPKDIVRSYSHEFIHFLQDLRGELENISTQNTTEDSHLDKIEREAYLDGNITFRNWTDSLQEEKSKKYLKEYKEYFLKELFEKDLPYIEKTSPTEYLVGNGEDIEAKYFFKFEDWDNSYSINWQFTPNNQNKSPEAWKKVITTSLKVIDDFVKTKNPTSIIISGDNELKTRIYKSDLFIKKLETLLNNEYKIDNSDEDKIVLRTIEESYKSSIQKRMDTLNESYNKSLDYWKNGDLNSKSKIERWNSIKKLIEREILKEFYINNKKIKSKKDPFGMYQFMRELLEEDPIMEGRYDTITNKISSDIFRKWKIDFDNGERTQSKFKKIYQTDDIEVEIEAYLSFTDKIKGLVVDGGVDEESDYMRVTFEINPNKLPEFWEEISFNLKDVVRHEIEHLTHGDGSNEKPHKHIPDDFLIRQLIKAKHLPQSLYFKLEKEVDANLQGMYLRAKKEKRPFKDVIDTYLDAQNITPQEKEEILDLWRKRLPSLNLPKF